MSLVVLRGAMQTLQGIPRLRTLDGPRWNAPVWYTTFESVDRESCLPPIV